MIHVVFGAPYMIYAMVDFFSSFGSCQTTMYHDDTNKRDTQRTILLASSITRRIQISRNYIKQDLNPTSYNTPQYVSSLPSVN